VRWVCPLEAPRPRTGGAAPETFAGLGGALRTGGRATRTA